MMERNFKHNSKLNAEENVLLHLLSCVVISITQLLQQTSIRIRQSSRYCVEKNMMWIHNNGGYITEESRTKVIYGKAVV